MSGAHGENPCEADDVAKTPTIFALSFALFPFPYFYILLFFFLVFFPSLDWMPP